MTREAVLFNSERNDIVSLVVIFAGAIYYLFLREAPFINRGQGGKYGNA